MRFPWLQFHRDAMERAGALASWLGEDEFRVRGMLLAAWAWGCTLGPEDAPADGVCREPYALKLLAAEMRYRGDPVILGEAMQAVGFLETLNPGIRIRGVSRYKPAWDKNQRRSGPTGKPAKSAGRKKNRSGSGPVPELTGPPEADAYAEKASSSSSSSAPPIFPQLTTQPDQPVVGEFLPTPGSAPPAVPVVALGTGNHLRAVPEPVGDQLSTVTVMQAMREERSLFGESHKRWAGVAQAERDFGREGLLAAYRNYLDSDTAHVKREGEVQLKGRGGCGWPVEVFLAQVEAFALEPRKAPKRAQEPQGEDFDWHGSIPTDEGAESAWKAIQKLLGDDGKQYALSWLERMRAVRMSDGVLQLMGPDHYFTDWVSDHYRPLLTDAFDRLMPGTRFEVTDFEAWKAGRQAAVA